MGEVGALCFRLLLACLLLLLLLLLLLQGLYMRSAAYPLPLLALLSHAPLPPPPSSNHALPPPSTHQLFSYNIDSHNTQRYISSAGVLLNEGDFELYGGPDGMLPYRVMLPKRSEASNLLASVPLSASHMGYGCLRLEPQLMILGQAAGVAASQAIAAGVAAQDLDIPTLQARLRALGAKIDL